MTIGKQPAPEVLREWAAKQLGMPIAADVAAARDHLLRVLARDEWLPSADAARAWTLLVQPKERLSRATLGHVMDDVRVLLREQVEVFARQFFTIDPAERTRQWQALWDRSQGFAVLRARLERLRPGLHVQRAAEPKLAEQLQESFVLPPQEQPGFSATVAATSWQDPAGTERTLAQVRQDHPDLVKLVPGTTRLLGRWRDVSLRLERARKRPRGFTSTLGVPKNQSYSWIALVIIGVVLGLVRAGCNERQRGYNQSYRSTTPFQLPKFDRPVLDNMFSRLGNPNVEPATLWLLYDGPSLAYVRTVKLESEALQWEEQQHRRQTMEGTEMSEDGFARLEELLHADQQFRPAKKLFDLVLQGQKVNSRSRREASSHPAQAPSR